jgi:hypothetical protein
MVVSQQKTSEPRGWSSDNRWRAAKSSENDIGSPTRQQGKVAPSAAWLTHRASMWPRADDFRYFPI